uniref:Uncharacterized protein n=3 Tax=Brassiceae TaxID=981071 RepID=R4I209_RAPSA|nr:orf131 [Brassica carinata]YP_009228078.1 hypothetical protein AYB38_gp70 [Brassica nigra]AEX57642.1 hypothetical protein RasatMp011 [Raphanus sativus]AEH43556.1 orf131 [Brassica carinata]AGC81701.1 hypothetical protein DCGMS_00410 [Raphanus sativus]AIE42544.1 hypothetical protein RadishMT_p012 [Raphanus sativus]AJD85457.1 hypothetical protein BniMp008 [Brassica nigra]
MWPNLLCHSEVSSFLSSVMRASVSTTLPCRKYRLSYCFPLRTTLQPFSTFKIQFSPLYAQPCESSVPSEIRFLFKSGTYLTCVRITTVPSSFRIFILPIPFTDDVVSFPILIIPVISSFNSSNHSFLGVMW